MTTGKLFLNVLTAIILLLSPLTYGQTKFSDPKATLKEYFWSQLYSGGGKTLFCDEEFTRKSVVITEGYIYSTSWIRDHLDCGTPWQCRENSQEYRRIASDMHNIFPENGRFDLDRGSAKFEDLPAGTPAETCGYKRSFGIIEPPNRIKGDIARALLYMHVTYDLPIYGDLNQIKAWSKLDPPSDEEITRNRKISTMQGNENPFISQPERVDEVGVP